MYRHVDFNGTIYNFEIFYIILISNNVDTVITRTSNYIITLPCNEIEGFMYLHYSNTWLIKYLMVRFKMLPIITNLFYYVETSTMRVSQLITKTIRLLNDEFLFYTNGVKQLRRGNSTYNRL